MRRRRKKKRSVAAAILVSPFKRIFVPGPIVKTGVILGAGMLASLLTFGTTRRRRRY